MELLSPKAICQRLGIGRTTLWRMERAGQIPRSITVSSGANGRPGRKGFVKSEIEAWIRERVADRDRRAA